MAPPSLAQGKQSKDVQNVSPGFETVKLTSREWVESFLIKLKISNQLHC